MTASVPLVRAERDPRLSARVVRTRPLHYADGADATTDRPAHLRAGSGLAWFGGRLAIVQDDANFLALVDPEAGDATPIALPAGPGGVRQFDDLRGNKAGKLDLEALVRIGDGDDALLLAIGSGSTARRESFALVRGVHRRAVSLVAAPAFYAGLRAATAFSGSELNVEGAVVVGDRLRLFNRGNGAPHGALLPCDATADVALAALLAHLADPAVPPPSPLDVVRYALGTIDGVALTFTDAALVAHPATTGRTSMLYCAAAEASPDATRDGIVAGCAVGVIDDDRDGVIARWAVLEGPHTAFLDKVEGIAPHPGDARRAYGIIDRDAHDRPCELCEIVLDGPWLAGA